MFSIGCREGQKFVYMVITVLEERRVGVIFETYTVPARIVFEGKLQTNSEERSTVSYAHNQPTA
jgi:hypothetical protein